MTRLRRNMLPVMPLNNSHGIASNEEDLYDYVWISSPKNDFSPESRVPDTILNTDSHNWGGHNEVNNGHSLRLPLLVVAACVVIPALIAAAIVFAVVKFRKSKHRAGSGIHYIECDSKSGQLNGAYKTPFDSHFVCFEKTDDVKMNLTKRRLMAASEGKIQILSSGGLFQFKDNNVIVSVPRHLQASTPEISIDFNTESNLPDFVVPKNILSDVITLSPHNATFTDHILIRIPINISRVRDTKNIQLMYSCTGEDEKPAWINLARSNKNIRHLDPIFWMLIGGDCYLFTTHFCHVFVTQFCSVLEQSALFLQASVHSQYDEDLNEMKLHVGFHCGKCNPDILNRKHDYGTLVGKCYKCIYGREGCVKVRSEMTDPLWMSTLTEMDIDTEDLLNLCNLDDIYPPLTFVYRPDQTKLPASRGVVAQVCILQGERKPVTIQGSVKIASDQSKKLQPLSLRKASDPVEHVDLSCSPREHSEDIPPLDVFTNGISQNKETSQGDHTLTGKEDSHSSKLSSSSGTHVSNNFSIALETAKVNKENMSLPAVFTNQPNPKFISEPKRNGGSIFEEHVRYEEKELCRLLDEKTELLADIAEEIGITKELCVSRHFNGQRMLQIWKILVITQQKTWIDLHSTLVKMKMVDAAHQLKMAYEKDLMI